MHKLTSWIARTALVALSATAFVACADAPTMPARSAAATQPHRMVAVDCVTADGCCDNSTAITDCSGGGGGGGGGGGTTTPPPPNYDVNLYAFNGLTELDRSEYYEIRQYFVNSSGATVYYMNNFLHGDAGAVHTDIGRRLGCYETLKVDLYLESVYFGHVTGDRYIGTISFQPGPSLFTTEARGNFRNGSTVTSAGIVYLIPGCYN